MSAVVDEAGFSALAQPQFRGLRAYDPGHDLPALRARFGPATLLELGSNENPYGPSPAARAAVLDALHGMHRYPDPRGEALKAALARHLGVGMECLLLGNGSHELLMQLAQVFAGPGREVMHSRYGFAVYGLAAQAAGARSVAVDALPMHDPMPLGHDLDAMAARVGPDTSLVYLANPNNPTGTWFGAEALRAFMARVPARTLVVVDEAYAELADPGCWQSALGLVSAFPNLIVTRTFSKGYALAGLRVGCLIGAPGLVAVMERVRESFNVNALALAAAEAALADTAHLQWCAQRNREQRDWLHAQFAARGLRALPSQTNFLLVGMSDETRYVEQALLERGVVLRPMAGYGLPGHTRITVGTPDENRQLMQRLDEVRA